MSESISAKKNLARIRDNQRRSRARRKEYMQELEEKVRSCEILGVTASAEIQSAARRVLDENKRLRHLLRQRGVSDEEIKGMLDGQDRGPTCDPTAAPALKSLLDDRRPCSSIGKTFSPKRDDLSVNINAAHSCLWTNPAPTNNLHVPQMSVSTSANPQAHHSGAPSSPSSLSSPPDGQLPIDAVNLPYASTYNPSPFLYNPADFQPSPPSSDSALISSIGSYEPFFSYLLAANIISGQRNYEGIGLEADQRCSDQGSDCKVDMTQFLNIVEKYAPIPTASISNPPIANAPIPNAQIANGSILNESLTFPICST